ncbi:MAG: hypothetical protein ACRDO1_13400 [Nocardioidaceae bacterium]
MTERIRVVVATFATVAAMTVLAVGSGTAEPAGAEPTGQVTSGDR